MRSLKRRESLSRGSKLVQTTFGGFRVEHWVKAPMRRLAEECIPKPVRIRTRPELDGFEVNLEPYLRQ
jgi:hypothetical protein